MNWRIIVLAFGLHWKHRAAVTHAGVQTWCWCGKELG